MEVAEESDGSPVSCRLGPRGGTLLHPTIEGQLRVIGSLALGGESPPSYSLREKDTEGKERDESKCMQQGKTSDKQRKCDIGKKKGSRTESGKESRE